ncbi:heme-dependent oxidative N-demethylase family protein [Jannaschia formosa]|uniref:heme-dependent oxidative N-demethylase family protein n=1 Tax=Jannaschia formosa TaxID=2259592 RepID=UPI000E1B9EA1|nr:DUF3445 domain-containing protein [Jannaschia formosa]TFL19651.1 DUF3445 domain-containing protein [Jannaschia formosa]
MILQAALPHTPWADPALSRLPGLRPVEGPWIVVDDAYGAQMAEKARLMAQRRAAVMQVLPGAGDALAELLETVLRDLPANFARRGGGVVCPDGREVATDGAPLEVIGQLIQEDVLLLRKQGAEHVLIAGLLCFPASWTLAEKIGRPLTAIHGPVPVYDAGLAARVQRLFDLARPGQPVWRANALAYAEAALFHPRTEAAPRVDAVPRFLRSERQTILSLPRSDAAVFAVHTWVVPFERLTEAQRAGCPGL